MNDSDDDSGEDSDEDSDDPQPSTSRGPSQRLAAKKTDNPELVKNRRKRLFQNNSSSSSENEQHAEKKILIDDSNDEIEVEARGEPVPSLHHEPSEHEDINQEEIFEEEQEPDHEDMNQEEIYEKQEDLINDYSSNQEEYLSNYSSYIICDKYIDEIWPRDDD